MESEDTIEENRVEDEVVDDIMEELISCQETSNNEETDPRHKRKDVQDIEDEEDGVVPEDVVLEEHQYSPGPLKKRQRMKEVTMPIKASP